MSNKNRKLRDIVIGTETWKWYVSDVGVVFFAPDKKRYAASTQKFLLDTAVTPAQQWDIWDGSNISVTPSRIKKYICDAIKGIPPAPKRIIIKYLTLVKLPISLLK